MNQIVKLGASVCLAAIAMVGLYYKVEYAGWVLLLAFLVAL